jgi:hypothetical protein
MQRSGTTLLQSILGAHPSIAAPPETHFIFRVAHLADYFGSLEDDDNLGRALHEALNPPIPLFEGCGFDEERVFERARTGARSYAALLDAIMSDFAERLGKPRWSEKTPNQPAVAVFDLFPNARIIHIVRDVRDVVASNLESPWEDRNTAQLAVEWRGFTLDNTRAGAIAGPSRFLQVRYEDLTSDPEAVVRSICCFVGEDYEPAMISAPERRATTIAPIAAPWQEGVLEPISVNRQGRYRESLSPLRRAIVASAAHSQLLVLGYSPSRRREIALGHVARAMLTPVAAARAASTALRRQRLRTPEDRYRETQRYLRRVASRVSTPCAPQSSA